MSDTNYAANRRFDVFTTGDSKDIALIENIAEWLRLSCGFQVAPPGKDTDNNANARIFGFFFSRDALPSAKLMGLMDSVVREICEHTGLPFIALLRENIPDEELPQIIADHGFIRIKGDSLNANDAMAIIENHIPTPARLRPWWAHGEGCLFQPLLAQ